jgi:hypothetical protein
MDAQLRRLFLIGTRKTGSRRSSMIPENEAGETLTIRNGFSGSICLS